MKFKIKNEECKMGFTLVELLVVIAVIGILAALLFPAFSAAKQRAIRVKCLSNVKQFNLGLLSYGHDNNDRLPQINLSTGWEPWDIPVTMVSQLQIYGLTRDVLYDPGFPEYNNDTNWNDVNYGVVYGSRDIGYINTFAGSTWLIPSNQNATIRPEAMIILSTGYVVAPDPSRRVLCGGRVLSGYGQYSTGLGIRATYDYTHYADDSGGLIRSAHLNARRIPIGDNMGMLDGSGKWEKFETMVPRTVYGSFGTLWW